MKTDLRDELRAYFDAMAADDTAGYEFERPPKRNSRRSLALVSVMVVATLIGAIALFGARNRVTTNVKIVASPTAGPTSPAEGPSSSVEASGTPWDLKWTQVADLGWTGNRDSAKAVVVDGELLIVGTDGGDASKVWSKVWGIRVGLDGNNTRPIAESPLNGRAVSSLVWTGTEFFVLGGSNGTEIKPYGAAYDPTHDSWRVIPPPPELPDDVSPTVVWTGKTLISWQTSSELQATGSSWHSIAPAPLTPRNEAATIGVDNKLFVWGGCEPTTCDYGTLTGRRDGAIYDPASGKWTHLSGGPFESGYGATAASRDDTVYMVASGSEQSGSSTFASFSLTTRTWTTLPPSPLPPRHDPRAVMLDSGSFVYGGGSDLRLFPSADIAQFDPQTSSWSVGKLPQDSGSLCSLTQSGNQLIAVMCGRTTTVHVATIS